MDRDRTSSHRCVNGNGELQHLGQGPCRERCDSRSHRQPPSISVLLKWGLQEIKSEINLVSNNANDPDAFAKPGDNLTLSFNSSETLQTPNIILADIASLNVMDTSINQETSWSAVHSSRVSSGDTNDNVTFSISYEDNAGNEGANRTQDNNSTNSIRIDTGIPELERVSLASNNPDNSTAMAGDQP